MVNASCFLFTFMPFIPPSYLLPFFFCYHFTPISSLRHTVPLFLYIQVSEAEDNQERSPHADVDVIGHHPETSTQVRAYSILPSNFGSSFAGDALSIVLCS